MTTDSTSNETKSWSVTVDEEGILTLPDELIALVGWTENDELEWIDQGDGSFLLVKRDESRQPGQTETNDRERSQITRNQPCLGE